MKLYNDTRIEKNQLPVNSFNPAISVSEAYTMFIVFGVVMLFLSYSFSWTRKRYYGDMVLKLLSCKLLKGIKSLHFINFRMLWICTLELETESRLV